MTARRPTSEQAREIAIERAPDIADDVFSALDVEETPAQATNAREYFADELAHAIENFRLWEGGGE